MLEQTILPTVNAYYHVDRFFSLVSSLGFPISTYFSHTTFPISVDHRGRYLTTDGIEVNAHCEGNGTGGIGYVGYCLSDTSNIIDPIGIALDWRIHLHELGGHGVLYEHVNSANFGFAHSAGDSISVIINDPDSHAPDGFRLFPWINIIRRCDRDVATWAWGSQVVRDSRGITISGDDRGYGSEEILETTLFRAYRSIGGDATADLGRRRFASRLMVYLILRAISTLTPATNPSNAIGFANALMTVDLLNWTTEGVYGGAYNKVIRWSFEKQGLYQAPGSPTPVTTPGNPPSVDVYIDDGRHGEYPHQNVHWNNTSIWNRRASDGLPDHQEADLGVPNYAYVKIKNRGTQTANNVKVKGYHCRPSAGVVWPSDFQPFTTAEIPVGTLAPNNTEEKIVGPFEWTPITNAFGHDCMLMIASADNDPSNIDNFTTGENIADWRLVPNDNNIGQRNVVVVPGGGGGEGLMKGLHGYHFWIGNPLIKKANMKLQVQIPDLLANNNWKISFKDIKENHLELQSGKQKEIVIEIQQGKDFTVQDIEKSKDKDIVISVYADDILIGGMTYRLDPKIKEPFNKPRQGPEDKKETKCQDKAQELLKCMDMPNQQVKDVCVKKITLDIHLDDKCDC